MKKAGDVVSAMFKNRFGQDFMETARSSASLFSSWIKVVSELWPKSFDSEQSKDDLPAVAVHSQISELERGLLMIEADHPGWIQILKTRQSELLALIQRRYPSLKIRGLAFKLSKEPFLLRDRAADTNEFPGNEPENLAELNVINEEPVLESRGLNSGFYSDSILPEQKANRQGKPDKEFLSALKNFERSIKDRNKRK